MKTFLTIFLLLVSFAANAELSSWSIASLHEGPGVGGEQNVLQTSLSSTQLVISLEISEYEPYAKGSWFLFFTTHKPVTSFQSVTAIANNSDGPSYNWPVEVLDETKVAGSDDGPTTIVLEVSYDAISVIGVADHLLFSHSDSEIETVLLWENFDEQFELLEAGIRTNEQDLDLDHLLLDDYDRNHLPMKDIPAGGRPPVEDIQKARTYLALTDTEIHAMSWYDVERAVFDKEQEEFAAAQAKNDAEEEELMRRNMHVKLWVESFLFPEHKVCNEPTVPESFATAEQAADKTGKIDAFAGCLQGNIKVDMQAFGELVTEAGGALDADTLQFEIETSYFIHCECVDTFVGIRDDFYRRNAEIFERWRTFEQAIAHLYESPGQ